MKSRLKILSIVEATSINAVAKNVMEFYRSARELGHASADFPSVEGCIVTFERRSDYIRGSNQFVETARELGLEVEVIPERRRFDLSVIPALRGIVEREQPQIVVTHSVKSHVLLWRSRLWRQFPWVAFHHGYTMTDRKMRVYNHLDRWSLRRADRLVTVCEAFARELARITGVPKEEIVVQHNSTRRQPPVDAAELSHLRSRFGIADDERVVLTVGRLSKEKAQIDLLGAFKSLCQTKPEIMCKLMLVGDGPERRSLEVIAKSFGCKEAVIFVGQVGDVAPFYALADVLVLPSHSEGSPNVLLEAMVANVPIVATSVGGVPEMVEDEQSALLVAPGDSESMAAAIVRLLTDKELAHRLRTNASKLVATRFSPERYVRSLAEIYRDVIDARKPAYS